MSHGPIYLDSQASTPVDPRVLDRMLPYFTEQCGNPSIAEHHHGEAAHLAVEESRQNIAAAFGCRSEKEIIFTSGATEANNLALLGAFARRPVSERHFIASAIEHSSVLEPLAHLENCGAQVTLLPVNACGRINPEQLQTALRPETTLVSVMFANNEIGTLQPIAEIGHICRAAGILFHCDAAQAVGHETINVEELHIDLMSFSAHKFYGPKGIGGLYVREGAAGALQPTQFGGSQERGLRPGTLNVPAIVGMATALQLAVDEIEQTNRELCQMANMLFAQLQRAFPKLRLNGDPEHKLARNLNITIPGVEAGALMMLLRDELSFSAGSACASAEHKPSHVLKAIGLSDEECFQTIRLGLSPGLAADKVARVLQRGIAAAPTFID